MTVGLRCRKHCHRCMTSRRACTDAASEHVGGYGRECVARIIALQEESAEAGRKHGTLPNSTPSLNIAHPPQPAVWVENGLRRVAPYFKLVSFWSNESNKRGETWWEYLERFRTRRNRVSALSLLTSDHVTAVCEAGRVFVDRQQVATLDVPRRKHQLLTYVHHQHEAPVRAQTPGVIFEDENVLVVDKPHGVPISAAGSHHNTLCRIVEQEYGLSGLQPLHRLDRMTSGVQILSKNKETTSKIMSAWKTVRKEYVAQVVGEFPSGEITCDRKIEASGFNYVVSDGAAAKPSSTRFRRLRTDGRTSLVLCTPLTGRTHQIRVHLRHLDHPILHDRRYNPRHRDVIVPRPDVAPAKRRRQEAAHEWDAACARCRSPAPPDPVFSRGLHAWRYHVPAIGRTFRASLPDWASRV